MQARHLKHFEAEHHLACGAAITVQIDGKWREVFEVWTDGDDPARVFGENSDYAKAIGEFIDYASPCWVVVRYVVEEKSNSAEIDDAIHRFRTCDLVAVQVPEPACMSSSEPITAAAQLGGATLAPRDDMPGGSTHSHLSEAPCTAPIRYAGIVEDGRSTSEVEPCMAIFGSTEDEVYQGILATVAQVLASGDDYGTDAGWLADNPIAAVPSGEPGSAQEWLESFRENTIYPYWTVLEAASLLDMRRPVTPDT